jgi:hypothetical protein
MTKFASILGGNTETFVKAADDEVALISTSLDLLGNRNSLLITSHRDELALRFAHGHARVVSRRKAVAIRVNPHSFVPS